MTIDIQDAQAGQLITAEAWNRVIQGLRDLDIRLAALEGGGGSSPPESDAIVITSVSPTTLKEGDDLTITGKNFGATMLASTVTFKGGPPDLFRSWTDTQIVCVVPTVGTNLPATGIPVTVEVSNFLTSQSRVITVQPRKQVQTGSIGVALEDVSPDPITASTNNDFKFTLVSDAGLTTTAAISVTLGGQSWASSVLDDQLKPLASNAIDIAPKESKTFYIRVPIPSGTNQAAFTLEVDATAPDLKVASTSPMPFKVGDFADPDTSFTMVPTHSVPAPALSGSSLTASASGDPVEIYFDVEFTANGKYHVTAETVPPTAAGWSVVVANPNPDATGASIINVTGADSAHPVPSTVELDVQPATASTASAQLRLHVKEESATKSRTYTVDLHAKA
ncbi:MAG: IPT/TIG domain-containing protein [Acidimicrobiia bacterium]